KQGPRFEMSRRLTQGAAITRIPFKLESTGTVTLGVEKLEGAECVLDSIFLIPRIEAKSPRPPDLSHLVTDSISTAPALVRNGNFEFQNLRRIGYPAEWAAYTGDREPWGQVSLVKGASAKECAVVLKHEAGKGWGCM